MSLLQTYLDRCNLRQSDFAARVDASQATISKLAAEKIKPGRKLAVRIERATSGEVPANSWEPEQELNGSENPTEVSV